jgi:hypothetical protein
METTLVAELRQVQGIFVAVLKMKGKFLKE